MDTKMNMTNIMLSLQLMWKGMLAIFVVILVIFLLVTVLLKLTEKRGGSQQD